MKPKAISKMITKWDAARKLRHKARQHAPASLFKSRTRSSVTHILQLPDELLVLIIDYATLGSHHEDCDTADHELFVSGVARALALTCRRLNRIAQPYAYHTIQLGTCTIAPPSEAAWDLNWTLKRRPELGKLCQVLTVHIPDCGSTPPPQDGHAYDLAHELLTRLPNLVCFRLWGGFGKDQSAHTRTLLRHVLMGSVHLKHIALEKMQQEPMLEDAITTVMDTRVKSLSINGTSSPWSHSPPYLLDEDREGSGAFTSLILHNFAERMETLSQFLSWPKALHHFTFTSTYENQESWTLASFVELLLPFKDTLRSLDLRWHTSSTGQPVDLLSFSNLESLRISTHLLAPINALDATQVLLAPKLKTLIWVFNVRTIGCEGWHCIQPEERDWHQSFIRNSLMLKTALQTIRFDFSPVYEKYTPAAGDLYPWDVLNELSNEIKSKGLRIEYSKPTVTKEEWLADMMEYGCCRPESWIWEQ